MKLTEKSLKQIVTSANLNELKTTTFGLRCNRGNSGYEVALVPRDGSIPPQILIGDGTASEAGACIEGVIATHKLFTISMMGSTAKPEFASQEHFQKQRGERCPKSKCNSRDIEPGWVKPGKGGDLEQIYRCSRCETEWIVEYRLEGYRLSFGANNPEASEEQDFLKFE